MTDAENRVSRRRWPMLNAPGAAILIAALFVFSGIAYMLIRPDGDKPDGFREYAYSRHESPDGVKIHLLKTSPDNIKFERVNANVADTAFFGVNGGFFYERALLSIAVHNDVPVNAASGYGSGEENVKYARGTLVWDSAAAKFSVQTVRSAADIEVTDRHRYWAQGGISLDLSPGPESMWRWKADAERMPFPDDRRLRTAAVYDDRGRLLLIVSENAATASQFRQAIMEYDKQDSDAALLGGIFLDGDGSSQLRSTEAVLPGDRRSVVQMIRLLR
ncbi:hypothetical protein [Paenibacillus methanolicus]|uniref:Phosphodiester glycosidase domain-containing protein n=1 Tax=Paenibacillus methanolicus TaxID=582686 RepID=A0A5S5CKV0_9BACL|nr:hypothetical protein [Paenibacillus methanolicus]TYP79593.1 hypothetical protein BCM02_101713 [Paenibacillus methanolicus]